MKFSLTFDTVGNNDSNSNSNLLSGFLFKLLPIFFQIPLDPQFVRSSIWVDTNGVAARHVVMATNRKLKLLADADIWWASYIIFMQRILLFIGSYCRETLHAFQFLLWSLSQICRLSEGFGLKSHLRPEGFQPLPLCQRGTCKLPYLSLALGAI